ncbi:hypothetical protein M427DRAFT_183705 [Gonapodya prolifera JEL478]|uniref:Uncharacterized protein n=1 Tax=Gonapodya prolifera (strain JEL478) TaxID=1344416 RepID=A0A139A0N5_GONPJ|nr:hypothetical protein M427DRAFT_183705 [Gonapodya prolifera JEL478]|eukprot:KXS10284.1 hypothetical protein M427DRAFT_183705 [Gonapodya prolifera JEL478]
MMRPIERSSVDAAGGGRRPQPPHFIHVPANAARASRSTITVSAHLPVPVFFRALCQFTGRCITPRRSPFLLPYPSLGLPTPRPVSQTSSSCS